MSVELLSASELNGVSSINKSPKSEYDRILVSTHLNLLNAALNGKNTFTMFVKMTSTTSFDKWIELLKSISYRVEVTILKAEDGIGTPFEAEVSIFW
jgi:hypothetical protein